MRIAVSRAGPLFPVSLPFFYAPDAILSPIFLPFDGVCRLFYFDGL